MDYARYSDNDLEPAYEVEFADAHGFTQALVTLSGPTWKWCGAQIQATSPAS